MVFGDVLLTLHFKRYGDPRSSFTSIYYLHLPRSLLYRVISTLAYAQVAHLLIELNGSSIVSLEKGTPLRLLGQSPPLPPQLHIDIHLSAHAQHRVDMVCLAQLTESHPVDVDKKTRVMEA